MRVFKPYVLFLCLGLSMVAEGVAAQGEAIPKKSFCVYDPIGANGPAYHQMRDYQAAALAWGVKFVLKPYTDERVAAEDFKAGVCDIVAVTGARARQFNAFTGTLDAAGGMPTYTHVKKALQTLSSPKAAPLMVQGDYEVIFLAPGGAPYLYVRDRRSMTSVKSLAGKRFTVFEADPSQAMLVARIGGSPISTSIAGMYSQFNNGSVDVTVGPAVVYQALELHKGLSPHGAVVDFPVGQLTIQVIARRSDLPPGFGQKSRSYAATRLDDILKSIKVSEDLIEKEGWWYRVSQANQREYSELFRQARLDFRKRGVYDGKMLTFLRKLRCSLDPARSECTAADQE